MKAFIFSKSAYLCFAMSLLYLVRGAYLPYFFPLYEHLSTLDYTQISVLMSAFLFIQASISPVIGSLHTSRTMAWRISLVSLLFLFLGLTTLFFQPNFMLCLISVLMIGCAIITLKNILCVVMIEEVDSHYLRKAVAIRTTGMNMGSFIGNMSALAIIGYFGSKAHLSFLLFSSFLLSHLVYASFGVNKKLKSRLATSIFSRHLIKTLHKKLVDFFKSFVKKSCQPWKNKSFIAESITLFAIVIPDGCWGTIIPKYLIDLYHSNDPLALIYTISLITILLFSYSVNGWLSRCSRKNGLALDSFKWLACLLFLTGLLCFSSCFLSSNRIFFTGLAVFLIILAEIVITPCFDEIAQKYGANTVMTSAYYGVLNLFDGLARIIGASIGLFLYGYLKDTWAFAYFWPLVVLIFSLILLVCIMCSKQLTIADKNHLSS